MPILWSVIFERAKCIFEFINSLQVSIWSDADAILGATNFAWGRLTSMIPNSDHSVIYKNHTHYSLKWMTVEDQFGFVVEHANFNTIHNSMNNTLIN